VLEGAEAVYPFPLDVQPYQAFLDIGEAMKGTGDATERGSAALEVVDDWADDNRPQSRYWVVGVSPPLPDDQRLRGGNVGVLYSDRQAVAVVREGRPLRTVAHELGHAIGLPHADRVCGGASDGQVGESWPPDDMGGLGDAVGIDRRTPPPYRVVAAGVRGAPARLFDLMSYCGSGSDDDAWISPRTWERAVAFRAPAQPTPRAASRRTATPRQAGGRTLRVSGFDAGAPRIRTVRPDRGAATPTATGCPPSSTTPPTADGVGAPSVRPPATGRSRSRRGRWPDRDGRGSGCGSATGSTRRAPCRGRSSPSAARRGSGSSIPDAARGRRPGAR